MCGMWLIIGTQHQDELNLDTMAPKDKIAQEDELDDEEMKGAAGAEEDDDLESEDESDSDDDDDVEIDQATLDKLMGLEEQLEKNPNLYEQHIEVLVGGNLCSASQITSTKPELFFRQTHDLMCIGASFQHFVNDWLQYIKLLRDAKLRARLRTAHEAMAELFPLNEQQWLDWINDELEQVCSWHAHVACTCALACHASIQRTSSQNCRCRSANICCLYGCTASFISSSHVRTAWHVLKGNTQSSMYQLCTPAGSGNRGCGADPAAV